jgi:hypothetical protein
MVEEVVRGVMRKLAGALSELAGQRGPDERALQETAAAAASGAETLVECRAVAGFSFDPDADPMASW